MNSRSTRTTKSTTSRYRKATGTFSPHPSLYTFSSPSISFFPFSSFPALAHMPRFQTALFRFPFFSYSHCWPVGCRCCSCCHWTGAAAQSPFHRAISIWTYTSLCSLSHTAVSDGHFTLFTRSHGCVATVCTDRMQAALTWLCNNPPMEEAQRARTLRLHPLSCVSPALYSVAI